MENISIISIISIALLGSLGHCVGMCGGIVLAYSSTKIKSSWSKKIQAFAHLLYSFGRITTYTIMGAFFGGLGSVIAFSRFSSGLVLIITGLLMFLVGLSLLGKIKFLTFLEHSCSKLPLYQNMFRILIKKHSLSSFYFLGVLNGLLPCGLVYVFAISASSTRSVVWGAFVMFIFGLCTIPAVFSLGFFIGLFKQSGLRNIFIKLASYLVIAFGLYTSYLGYIFMNNISL